MLMGSYFLSIKTMGGTRRRGKRMRKRKREREGERQTEREGQDV